jgi:hypothetical protein
MKRTNIFICALFSLLLFSCEHEEYYKGEYIIHNDCDEMIDCYGIGINFNAPNVSIHDRIPAKSKLSYRKITITEKAKISDVFESIEIYKNGQKAIKNPMNQELWLKSLSNKNLTYTLVVDSSFFR